MSELLIGDKLIDPVAGPVVLEDVTGCGKVTLRVVSTGHELIRSIHYVQSFVRVPSTSRRPAIALAFGGILFAALCAAGVIFK